MFFIYRNMAVIFVLALLGSFIVGQARPLSAFVGEEDDLKLNFPNGSKLKHEYKAYDGVKLHAPKLGVMNFEAVQLEASGLLQSTVSAKYPEIMLEGGVAWCRLLTNGGSIIA